MRRGSARRGVYRKTMPARVGDVIDAQSKHGPTTCVVVVVGSGGRLRVQERLGTWGTVTEAVQGWTPTNQLNASGDLNKASTVQPRPVSGPNISTPTVSTLFYNVSKKMSG
jgi:hypothetical protein